MALRLGQVLVGRKGSYRLVEALKGSEVFKAQVLQGSSIKADLYVSRATLSILERKAYLLSVSLSRPS